MIITIIHQTSDTLLLKFMRYGNGRRLWIRDPELCYQSIGWCPHININSDECPDCALVVEN